MWCCCCRIPVCHHGYAAARRFFAGAKKWWARKDLNLEPTDYESAALTVELRALGRPPYYKTLAVFCICTPTSARPLGGFARNKEESCALE